MIQASDKVELKATVTTVGTDTFSISINEIFVDSKWQSFSTPKTLSILTTDYDTTVITSTEKALAKTLLEKYSATLTGDDLVSATSLLAKL